MSPTARSLRLLRSWKFHADVVERWLEIPDGNGGKRKIRKDCFSAFDLLAFDPSGQAWLIQTTSDSNLSSRAKKLSISPIVADLVRSGVVVECWGWQKLAGRWQVRRERLQSTDAALEAVRVTPKRRRGSKRLVQPELFGDDSEKSFGE